VNWITPGRTAERSGANVGHGPLAPRDPREAPQVSDLGDPPTWPPDRRPERRRDPTRWRVPCGVVPAARRGVAAGARERCAPLRIGEPECVGGEPDRNRWGRPLRDPL